MRFRNLTGLTSLPVEAIRYRFRNEDVLTVLPVSTQAGRESVLIATSAKLIIVTARPGSDEWMTQLAPWAVVRLADEEIEDDTYRLLVRVGSLTFHAALEGTEGQKALRDFVVVTRAQLEAIGAVT